MKLKLVKFLSPSLIVLPIVVNATSCSGSAGIVFGNFESYMSPSLIEVLQKEVSNSNFLSYSTNEDIQIKFKKYYDIAIPSTYTVLELIKDKELAKFD
jgi:spermidine/putrescine-binding protein